MVFGVLLLIKERREDGKRPRERIDRGEIERKVQIFLERYIVPENRRNLGSENIRNAPINFRSLVRKGIIGKLCPPLKISKIR